MRSLACFLVLAALWPLAGCYRYATRVPGVLDMRTDASQGAAHKDEAPLDPDVARDGVVAVFLGEGVTRTGDEVHVEERRYYLRGLVPIVNESAREELEAAVGDRALRDVTIGEEIHPVSAVLGVVVPYFFPLAGIVLPPYDFVAEGRPVEVPGAAAPPPASPVEPGEGRELPSPLPLPEPPPLLDTPPLLDDAPFHDEPLLEGAP